MSNGAPEPPYSVDTSSLMEWQARFYPPDDPADAGLFLKVAGRSNFACTA